MDKPNVRIDLPDAPVTRGERAAFEYVDPTTGQYVVLDFIFAKDGNFVEMASDVGVDLHIPSNEPRHERMRRLIEGLLQKQYIEIVLPTSVTVH